MIWKRIDFIQMIFQFNNYKVYWISYKYAFSKVFFVCADLFFSKTLVISDSKKIH